jgi:hypothetical protein
MPRYLKWIITIVYIIGGILLCMTREFYYKFVNIYSLIGAIWIYYLCKNWIHGMGEEDA